MSYTESFLATSPVAYYLLNETAGSTSAADSSGNSHTATLQGTGTFGVAGLIPGESDTALLLNGAGVLALPNLNLAAPFSLSGIAQPTGDAGTNKGYGTLMGAGSSRRVLWADPTNSNRLLVQMGAAGLYTPNNSVPPGSLLHWVYTTNGTTETIYINGAVAASQANAASSWNTAGFIGGYQTIPPTGSYQLAATLEKFGVNNTCLSAATVASLAAEALNPPGANGVTAMVYNGTAWVPATGLKVWVDTSGTAPQPTGANAGDIFAQGS